MYGTRSEAAPVNPSFEIVLRGFDRQQVIDHVNALKSRVATIGAERDTALQRNVDLTEQLDHLRREAAEAATQVDRMRREAADAATQVDRLQRSPLTAATARIQRMLQMAEDEAAELQVSAEQEITSLRESARAEAARLLHETAEQCEHLDAESTSRRAAAEAESTARCRQAEVESDRRRRAAEQQAEHDIASRQAETEAWICAYQTRSVAALHLVMLLAHDRLQRRTVAVEQQVTALRQLRAGMTDQVHAVHRLLVEAVDLVDQPVPADQPTPREQADAVQSSSPVQSSNGSPPQAPARDAGGSGKPRALRQGQRPGPHAQPRQAAAPTARFGLHR